MLVLSRKKGESIVIQDNIEITVLGVEGDVVRLGISAPSTIDILRKEIYLSIQDSNRASAAPETATMKSLVAKYRQQTQNE
ncbi:carbon storage regulator CsrA [Paenibacillus sp. JX-17]|uniref:Translational regulator CsrA n=1 Tax=Paenibacillus lacisoli TaxID=3064525 RepID=A0ABT9CFV9_9BACL|nr:carbon storage regulator CsrA [Paenibacillus sp. JX-17]MDO7906566.1 carbon storage regulator CsrA [Paenibacillus sp. JX-17]